MLIFPLRVSGYYFIYLQWKHSSRDWKRSTSFRCQPMKWRRGFYLQNSLEIEFRSGCLVIADRVTLITYSRDRIVEWHIYPNEKCQDIQFNLKVSDCYLHDFRQTDELASNFQRSTTPQLNQSRLCVFFFCKTTFKKQKPAKILIQHSSSLLK